MQGTGDVLEGNQECMGDFLTVDCRKDSIWTLRDLSGQCMTSTGRGDWLGGPRDLPSFLCVLCSKTGSPHSVDLQGVQQRRY